jgi:hypothetical protein
MPLNSDSTIILQWTVTRATPSLTGRQAVFVTRGVQLEAVASGSELVADGARLRPPL